MLNKLTIIIPTHERHTLLKRSLSYYKSWKCLIIVADSSKDKYTDDIPSNVTYLHLSQHSFSKKILFALGKVKSRYTCLCADDDFLSPQGLITGIDFLNINKDHVSVQGRYISFKITKNFIDKFVIYHQKLDYKVDSNSPDKRLIQAFSPYMQHFYALHRTNALIQSMELASKVPTLICAEISVALIPMLIGKHKALPIFWMARDSGLYSEYSTSPDSENRIVSNWSEYLNSDEGYIFTKYFSESYYANGCGSIKKGRAMIKKVFYIYDGRSHTKTSRYREKLKGYFPKYIRILICRIKNFYYDSLYRKIHTFKLKILKISGYPWSDKISEKEWQCMKKVIHKFNTEKLK